MNAGLAALLSAYLISRVPAQVIIGVSPVSRLTPKRLTSDFPLIQLGLMAMIVGNIPLATAAPNATYWTNTFFAAGFAAFGPDLTFTAAQIIASNTVNPSQQGVAG